MRKIFSLILVAMTTMLYAQEWHTHFAYNNVTQIAMSDNDVYALSDGSLFSVHKNSEQLHIYDNLHASGISCIYYDELTHQLLIAYTNGKLDLLSSKGVQYIGDLYDKDMTQQKNIYNVTVNGYTAYFSTHYGIQTFDLRTNTLVDSYWIGNHGQEMKIEDVLIANDSIYAFTTDSLFCAGLKDNLVDYRDWHREKGGRISRNMEKGKHYQDATDHWYAGGSEGIKRITPTDTLTYKPLGPLNNTPYRMTVAGTKLFVVNGGRWTTQNNNPGVIMIYEEGTWTNITQSEIIARVGSPVLDFMNVAVDPVNKEHFWVTSYGTGLYEFQGTEAIRRFIASEDTPLKSASRSKPQNYTRLDNAVFDGNGTVWFLNAYEAPYPLIGFDRQDEWHGVPLTIDNQAEPLYTPASLLLDNRNPNHKWIAAARAGACVILLDDNGTPDDPSDDKIVRRNTWITPSGQQLAIDQVRDMIQDTDGRIWVGTDKGIVIIDTTDYFVSDRCLRPELLDDNGENPLETQKIMALCQDTSGRIWVGTESLGVYVLNEEANEILAHYTSDNSPMLTNSILSLACDEQSILYIGTAEGLVSFKDKEPTDGASPSDKGDDANTNYGTMQQWRLHYSYSNPQEIVASQSHIYVLASGALYSLDRQTEEIKYWSKANGLTGSTIAHIAYDGTSQRLVVAYEDGRIDLLTEEENVIAMPDLYIKAASISTTINSITIGKKAVYMSMSFGILAVNPTKAEIIDTYYIGEEAAAVEVKCVAEAGDSLYAFTDEYVYSAALKDNLVDYAYWHKTNLPTSGLKDAAVYHDNLYALIDNWLYLRNTNNMWTQISTNTFAWIHACDNNLLALTQDNHLVKIADNGQITDITNGYGINDAVYSQGEYWLVQEDMGLVRLSANGTDHFRVSGPNSNFSYKLHTAHNQIYSLIGGRWASQFLRYAKINIFDGVTWQCIDNSQIGSQVGASAIDPVSIAVDPSDAGHFFIATYGTGVFEFRDYKAVKHHTYYNSSLRAVSHTIDPVYYTRTDGATMDSKGNLWVLNATEIGQPLHFYSNGQWHGIPLSSGGKLIQLTTPTGILIDRRDSNRKWIIDQRGETGLILFDDGGTPTNTSDDKCIKRSSWVDQNSRVITPENVLCMTQDHSNRIWIGTQAGIITIPSSTDFFSSNSCHRIIIPRNDGTNLGDYLLGDERINCMAVDGGNRIWIGTENSGLYLIEDDTITVAHFTENNSLLPSNTIQSIAIQPSTGEVFVGTARGLASYRSDASEPEADLSNAYAFPNPVRHNYGGVISIVGLMENTAVNIVDAGGNLVCKTKSHGGLAVWDGKLPDGRYATPGVYTALCNEPNGKHTVVKILVIQ